MSRFILDASALLAFVRREPGGTKVGEVLKYAAMSAVNFAEVLARSLDGGADLEWVDSQMRMLPITVIPFGRDDASKAAALRPQTQHLGLSLADRCCVALGLTMGLPVLTADQRWAELDAGVTVEFIR